MTTVIVNEVTMAAPDIIRVEIWDSPITKQGIHDTGVPNWATRETWTIPGAPVAGISDYGYAIGPNNQWVRFQDLPPAAVLDRLIGGTAVNVSNYSAVGGIAVTAVDHESIPFDYGKCRASDGVSRGQIQRMKHFLYLTLASPLPQGGPYTIHNTASAFPDATFTFNDKTTRACAIHVNQVGHRRKDASKLGYLSQWHYSPVNEGAIDFAGTYGLNTFEIIDDNGWPWFRGSIVKRIGPADAEANAGYDSPPFLWKQGDASTGLNAGVAQTPLAGQTYSGGGFQRLYPSTKVPKVATAVTTGNPTTFTCVGHGFSTGDIKWLWNFGKTSPVNPTLLFTGGPFTITVTGADTFTAAVTTTGTWVAGTYRTGYDSLIYDTVWSNRARTYVFGLDYSTWAPAKSGGYRIRIPGLGVSDRFVIDESIWHGLAKVHSQGFYHQCSGLALDGRAGYTRPAPYVDGVNGYTVFKSLLMSSFSDQNEQGGTVGLAVGGGALAAGIPMSTGNNQGWLTAERQVGFFGSFFDAGDQDSYLEPHVPIMCEMLTLGYQELLTRAANIGASTAIAATSFNFPKSSTTLDPTIYTSATDVLPDAVHQATWVLDCYRRMQNFGDPIFPDGSVMSGFCPMGTSETAGNALEPSYFNSTPGVAAAPDHAQNYVAAFGFAKMAQVYGSAGFSAIKTLYQNAAIAAWNWAESIYQSDLTATPTLRDAYYGTTLGMNVVPTGSVSSNTTAGTVLNFAGGTPAGLKFGMTVTSTGTIPTKITVTAFDATTVTVSGNVTVLTTDTLTFNIWSLPATGQYTYAMANMRLIAQSWRQQAAAGLYRLSRLDTYRFPCESQQFGFLGNLVSGNAVQVTVNGTVCGPVSFTTDHPTTMRAVCAAIMAAVPTVSATCGIAMDTGPHVVDARLITVEAITGGVSPVVLTSFTVTGAGAPAKSPPSYTLSIGNSGSVLQGQWDYLRTPGANAGLVATAKTAVLATTVPLTTYMGQVLGSIGYQNFSASGGNNLGSSSIGQFNGYAGLIRSFIVSEENSPGSGVTAGYLKRIQEGESHELGANQYGHCWTVGLGTRWPIALLCTDAKALSVSAPNGITPYTRDAGPWLTTTGNPFGDQIPPGSANGVTPLVCRPAPAATSDPNLGQYRVLEPFQYMFPLMQCSFECPDIISQFEFTVEQCILTRQLVSMWCHAWDGNSATALNPGIVAGMRF